MSKIKCTCGNGMSNSDVPSKNILKVFRETDIKAVLENSPSITLFDFETSDCDGFEYWYCTECKRVHVVENIPNGTVVKKYHVSQEDDIAPLNSLIALYVFTATEIYEAEEENFDITLAEFIKENGDSHMYFTNNGEKKVYKKNNEFNGCLVYEEE